MSAARLAVSLLLVAATAAATAAPATPVPGRAAIAIPYTVAGWRGVDAAPIDPEAERALGATVMLNRTYADAAGPVGFYLAYYDRQGPGVSIHSPRHCLPGTGWDILSDASLAVDLRDGTAGQVRRLVAQKDGVRVLVLYWHALHGRMVASDWRSRLALLGDRVRFGRNDGALVRLVVPVTSSERAAERRGAAFVRDLAPYLGKAGL